jgi:AcrR family transcriptional regulator
MPDAPVRPRRGRPRDASIDVRVLRSAVDELAENGVGGFSVNSVAARAGVAKRGIYARWPDRDDLVLDALGTLAAGLIPPRTGSLRGDLLALAPLVDAVFTEPRMSILARCVAELARYPLLYAAFRRESVDRCAAVVEDAFQQARARGETRRELDTDMAAGAFIGALLAARAFGPSHPPAPPGTAPVTTVTTVEAVEAGDAGDGLVGTVRPRAEEAGSPARHGPGPAAHHRLVEFCLAAVGRPDG